MNLDEHEQRAFRELCDAADACGIKVNYTLRPSIVIYKVLKFVLNQVKYLSAQ